MKRLIGPGKSPLVISLLMIIAGIVYPVSIVRARPKSLKVVGPLFAEVGENIVFTVTSGGLPVRGVTVSFAGYRGITDERGLVSFRVNFTGVFKAIASKSGYEDGVALVLVLPKGNDKFRIRAFRLHEEQVGTTIFSYMLAGANFASIKAYYLRDEHGNIYPAIIGEHGFIRVPHEVQHKSLSWTISVARDWGLEVYLIAEVLPEPLFGENATFSPLPELTGERMLNYLKQSINETLILARFAEEQDVAILDANVACALEDGYKVYESLVPEIRELYRGELAIGWDLGNRFVRSLKFPDINYSKFDVLTPRFNIGLITEFNTPSKLKRLIIDVLDYVQEVKRKYGIKVLVTWIASLELYEEHEADCRTFFSNFKDYEEARIWLIRKILEEAAKRDIDGVEVYTQWFYERAVAPHGIWEGAAELAVWQSKRPLNTVAAYLVNPWNAEERRTLRILEHSRLASINIIAKSESPLVKKWVSSKIKSAYEAFGNHSSRRAEELASEILEFLFHVENPLNIAVDGNGDEWLNLDPVYFNPSKNFPWFNLVWIGEVEAKDVGNLKCVYAANDKENLYLMLEFYGRPPKHLPLLAIDTSGEWRHESRCEFHIPLSRGLSDLWRVSYEGMSAYEGHFNPQNPNSTIVGSIEVRVNDVVELRIPLKFLGNPEKVNLIVWYPGMAPWGDVEVDIVDWRVGPENSSVVISTSTGKVLRGESLVVRGFIYPAHANSNITLTYTMSNGTVLHRSVKSSLLGEFEDVFTPKVAGSWKVKASWSGDLDHGGAESPEVSFTVLKPAEFVASNLVINPAKVEIGEIVSISANVTNIGDVCGTYTVYLRINGLEVDNRTVTLAGGESTIVRFEVAKDEAGVYSVELAGLKGSFIVRKVQRPPLLGSYTAIAVLVVIILIAFWRKLFRISTTRT